MADLEQTPNTSKRGLRAAVRAKLIGERWQMADLCRELPCGERQAANLLREGMPSTLVDGRRVFDPTAIEAWLAERMQRKAA